MQYRIPQDDAITERRNVVKTGDKPVLESFIAAIIKSPQNREHQDNKETFHVYMVFCHICECSFKKYTCTLSREFIVWTSQY